ncbi:MAG: hypothetical protein BZ136_00920 [Methanosphaera sp. rholeuAM74]|nr:MAG: hypothetical protein BZ136_00920 [Methanosphaera sp. rholeuAM74]
MNEIDYLLEYLLTERGKTIMEIPDDFNDKFNMYRALVNTRQPHNISKEYLDYENIMLQEVLNTRKVIYDSEIEALDYTHPDTWIENSDRIALLQADITTLEVDAIVNAANSQGLGCFHPCHNCIDNQIHTYAGVALRLECKEHMERINYNLPTSHAFTTNAYNLPSDYVIHTVGPIIQSQLTPRDEQLLAKTYINSLDEAVVHDIKCVAFPSISTGVFSFPKDAASKIVLGVVDEYLKRHDELEKVILTVYSEEDWNTYDGFIKDCG